MTNPPFMISSGRTHALLTGCLCVAALLTLVSSAQSTGSTDHAPLDGLLKAHVRADGRVDYAALAKDAATLDRYIASLARVKTADLSRPEQLALYVNAYNACTLRLILDHWPVKSIMDIPEDQRWKSVRWEIAGRKVSLDELEHELIRPVFKEPRIHFAVNCASVGCPPLRAEAYVAGRLDEQLQQQAERTLRDPRWLRVDPAKRTVHITKLFEWFADDWPAKPAWKAAGTYAPALAAVLKSGPEPTVQWIEWDWALNAAQP